MRKGFDVLKFASTVAYEGEYSEMQQLRRALGPSPKILIDFHYRNTAAEAIQKISKLEPLDLYVAEAPVAPEDVEGLAQVAAAVHTPIAIGEELRTVYEYLPRFQRRPMHVTQPEMGRTGLTSFVDICELAQAFDCRVMPHASIGIGIFQVASLQVAATLQNCPLHTGGSVSACHLRACPVGRARGSSASNASVRSRANRAVDCARDIGQLGFRSSEH